MGFIYCFFILLLVYLTTIIELRSSSFPFGRTRASSILLSLNHDLFTFKYVYTLSGRLAVQSAAVERIPTVIGYCFTFIVNDSRGAVVVEV